MGRIHLNLYHTVWLRRVSNKKNERSKSFEESSSPSMLARSLSLKRANERAKEAHYRPECKGDENFSQHRFSQSIDALLFLSDVKEYGQDWFRSKEFSRGKKEQLCEGDGEKNSNGFVGQKHACMRSRTTDPKLGPKKKAHSLEKKGVKFDGKEKGELCREDGRKDSNLLWIEELSSVTSEGSDPKCGLKEDVDVKFEDKKFVTSDPKCGLKEDVDIKFEDMQFVSGDPKCGLKEDVDVKFEDKQFVSNVQEQTKKVSMENNRARRVASSLSACLPSEAASRSLEGSVALVKYSYNPYKDFKDSMTEIILAGNMKFSNSDLEELLYCYFSLNSPEHYDLIRKAFMDVCIELQAV